jgi:hypothetical protein
MMTGKKLFVTILALVALVAWGAATPNLTVAQDQLQTRDRLLMQTPGSCLPACLPAPTKDQLHTQTRDKLQTPTATVVAPTQPKPQATVAATLPKAATASGDTLKLRTKDQIHLQTPIGGGRR